MKPICCGVLMAVWLAGALPQMAAGEAPVREPARISCAEEDFRKGQAHQVREVVLDSGGTLLVELGSNPTTGFSWGTQATNGNPAVLRQVKHQRVEPKAGRVGAGGAQVWTFESLKSGETTLTFSYDRPWKGGEKGVWTLKVVARVK